jgi:hypothetical protein
LYSGTTLAVRQEAGGSYSIALSFKNDARHVIPSAPRNFNNYGGSWLKPLLFVALYLCLSMFVSSSGVMWCSAGFVNGVYVSGGMVSSWKMSLLNFVKVSRLISIGLVSLYFSMFQNSFGLYLSISGRSNCSFDL